MTYHRTVWALECLIDEFFISIGEVHKVSEDVVKSWLTSCNVRLVVSKARNIKQATEIIVNRYHGELPKTEEELMTLPGVDEDIAELVHKYAYTPIKQPGIPVTTKVHRMLNRLGWVGFLTKDGKCINTQLPWDSKA
jgi:endonuclease III